MSKSFIPDPTAPVTHPVTGPIVCQPWCEDHDGHELELFADDQVCMSEEATVQMSLAGVELTSSGVTASEIGVLLHDDHGTQTILINPDRSNGRLALTADEADQLAQVLVEHARILRGEPA